MAEHVRLPWVILNKCSARAVAVIRTTDNQIKVFRGTQQSEYSHPPSPNREQNVTTTITAAAATATTATTTTTTTTTKEKKLISNLLFLASVQFKAYLNG